MKSDGVSTTTAEHPPRETGSRREDPRRQVARLYLQYGPAVFRRCLRLLRNRSAAEDATQDVFVKILKRAEALGSNEAMLPWVYRVATNHCLNLRRDAARKCCGACDDLDRIADGSPGASAENYPLRRLAQAVLDRFDSTTQQVAVAVLVDGMQLAEAAESIGISTRSVSRKLHRFEESARRYLTVNDAAPEGRESSGTPGPSLVTLRGAGST